MLKLTNIKKVYSFGQNSQTALNGVSVEFRKNEFVSVLGPSGCGKTTLLNIIGGLDRYTDGDLMIKGISTKEYRDGDWDTYRNRSVGFVFQSYNLIPHQSILSNVELAMTLSGVKRSQRRERAKAALERVGLGEYLHKKPNQMSGGQMQRVAIARALVNNPEILLADEPTGALDSETSEQIMELLKEIAKDRLVIMVTHNPELAERYSTRIIRLMDGKITGDTDPYEPAEEVKNAEHKKAKKKPMSFITAISLSLNNLMTKKGRTLLTSFAGSIGIIGIALILSLSNGIQLYIDKVQEDTLSTYPITIQSETVDYSSMFTEAGDEEAEPHENDAVYSNSNMQKMLNTMLSGLVTNDLGALKEYFDDESTGMSEYVSDIKYTYGAGFSMYADDENGGYVKVDTVEIIDQMYDALYGIKYSDAIAGMGSMSGMYSSMNSHFEVMSEMLDNKALLESQYTCLKGDWPSSYDEMVLVVDENNEIMDMVLYALGLRDRSEISEYIDIVKNGEEVPINPMVFKYEDLIGKTFQLIPDAYRFADSNGDGIFEDLSEDEERMNDIIGDGITITISGIVRPAKDAVATSIGGVLGYTKELSEHVISLINDSAAIKAQTENPGTDIFTGIDFRGDEEKELTMDDVRAYVATLPEEEQMQYQAVMSAMEEETILEMFRAMLMTNATYDGNLDKIGYVDETKPVSVAIYPKDFASKEAICDKIDEFNANRSDEEQIKYTDIFGILMSSVSIIVNIISYVLIAFVSISLVVSSIMIGIITYISVLERTKEIGILRAIGASKKDISRVFNAETLIVGFGAGAIGIAVTVLLCLPINAIIHAVSGVYNVSAQLPVAGGVILVLISMFLTFIAGLIPSMLAAKKDPVVALRSE